MLNDKLRGHHAFSYVAYTLHDRAGTLASLLYKAEKPSVRLSVRRDGNSAVSAWTNVGLALHDSYVIWHVQVCFKKFPDTIVCPHKR